MKNRIYIVFAILATYCFSAKSQSIDEAKQWFQEGRYTDALPVLRAEYEKNANNPAFNLMLGISEYKAGNYFAAEKYLSFASKKNQPDASLYLGDLYTILYRTADAGAEYAKYQKAKRRDQAALDELDKKLAYLSIIEKSLNKTENIQIIDSVVVNKSAFLSAYKLSAASGSLQPVNEFFKNQALNNNVLFINERKDKIYYSHGDEESNLDLFTMEKLLDNFGNEKRLPANINTKANEAFPFVMPDGLTLYFSSEGHNSIGGYDLFVTRYNIASDSYLNPSWLNMPFNSVFNDYMMAIDEERGIGWFASDRFQPAGKVCIYTFIPSKTVTLVESDDANYLANRARIGAIRDSWKEGVDYSSILAAPAASNTETATKKDFSFVINDAVTYHALSDFRSDQARNLYAQVLDKEKSLEQMHKELDVLRLKYTDDSRNGQLRTSILQLEKQTELLQTEIENLKIQSRNNEIRQNF